MGKQSWRFLLLPFAALALAAQTGTTPADDAYHYQYWPNNQALSVYTEWWYFNLYDPQQNLQAVLVYFVTDPADIGLHGLAPMLSVAYTPSGIVTNVDLYAASAFSAAYDKADVQLSGNAIQALDANTYHLTGAALDGKMSWDLMYAREAQPFQGFDRAALGKQPWEKMSWLAYMPRAHVTGQLTVNGQVSAIDTYGYHDHNWGEWVPQDVLWNWAQYSQPGFWFDIYDIISGGSGTARVQFNGQTFDFTKSQYQLVHTKWAYDSVNHLNYPVETAYSGDNGSARFAVTMSVIQTDPLSFGFPYPIPEFVIYEQTASYTGQISIQDASGNWQPPKAFQGQGFKEYTAERQ